MGVNKKEEIILRLRKICISKSGNRDNVRNVCVVTGWLICQIDDREEESWCYIQKG